MATPVAVQRDRCHSSAKAPEDPARCNSAPGNDSHRAASRLRSVRHTGERRSEALPSRWQRAAEDTCCATPILLSSLGSVRMDSPSPSPSPSSYRKCTSVITNFSASMVPRPVARLYPGVARYPLMVTVLPLVDLVVMVLFPDVTGTSPP